MVRGELFRLPAARRARGHEQRGARLGVVVQSDAFAALSTVLVSPTSTHAPPGRFHPRIEVDGVMTHVIVEHTRAVDVESLGRSAGRLDAAEMRAVDEALELVLGLG